MIESAVENDICILYVIYKEGEQKTHTQQLILNEKKIVFMYHNTKKERFSIETSRREGAVLYPFFYSRRVHMCRGRVIS